MRRSETVTIKETDPAPAPGKENRDAGKSFVITEVSAVQSEEWALRALLALGMSGISVPQEMADAGLIGFVLIGYQAFMGAKPDEVLPLWREILPACVKYKAPSQSIDGADIVMPWSPGLIEEVSTLLLLRQRILEMHTGFTLAEIAQKLREATLAKKLTSPNT